MSSFCTRQHNGLQIPSSRRSPSRTAIHFNIMTDTTAKHSVRAASTSDTPASDRGKPQTDFSFPVTPYDVQLQLMHALYSAIDDRAVGLFESPTGTGKTLSIICATLTWLKRNRISPPSSSLVSSNTDSSIESDDPPWVAEQTAQQHETLARDALRSRAREYNARVRAIKMPALSSAISAMEPNTNDLDDLFGDISGSSDDGDVSSYMKRRTSTGSVKMKHGNRQKNKNRRGSTDNADVDINTSLTRGKFEERENHRDDTCNRVRPCRIIFATRTHSQISQFVQEMRRTSFFAPVSTPGQSISGLGFSGTLNLSDEEPPLTVFSFGSRKHMCVNDSVLALKSSSAITERCRELTSSASSSAYTTPSDSLLSPPLSTQKRKRTSRSQTSCPFHDKDLEDRVRDTLLTHSAPDIEEAVRVGRSVGGCPYFATRAAVAQGDADLIMVPYAGVLHASTRKSLGLTIDSDTIVVFDEAHNLPNCVRELHSCVLRGGALKTVIEAGEVYVKKFITRLSTNNLFKVRQTLTIAKGLKRSMEKYGERTNVVGAEQLVFDAGIDNVNFVNLVDFLQESRLCQKLRGYINYNTQQPDPTKNKPDPDSSKNTNEIVKKNIAQQKNTTRTETTTQTQRVGSSQLQLQARQDLDAFERFVECLCHAGDYARIAVYPTSDPLGSRLRYFVVDGSALFSHALRDARSLLLVGGTLSPREGLRSGLLRTVLKSTPPFSPSSGRKLFEFECDHVVPRENVMARACSNGPNGIVLEFTHRNRPLKELHAALSDIVHVSCGGVVVFFASYDLLQAFSLTSSLCIRPTQKTELHGRRVFREVRGDVNESAWKAFKQEIQEGKGRAVLLAVMGGKLSEGINFSDELGRVVIMVGMPFANARHPETAEILKAATSHNGGAIEGNEVLENECMTVVNQCVGRAVRHRKDYASIVFLDRRYIRPGVMRKMPRFILRDMQALGHVRSVCDHIGDFFKRHR